MRGSYALSKESDELECAAINAGMNWNYMNILHGIIAKAVMENDTSILSKEWSLFHD